MGALTSVVREPACPARPPDLQELGGAEGITRSLTRLVTPILAALKRRSRQPRSCQRIRTPSAVMLTQMAHRLRTRTSMI